MEKQDLIKILLGLDSSYGKFTKIKILKELKKLKRCNTYELSLRINNSHTHIKKFLDWLQKINLVEYEVENFIVEYTNKRNYNRRIWKLTEVGESLVEELDNINFNIAPNIFYSFLNNKIRSSEKYKKWREEVLKLNNYSCKICGDKGESIQAHHIIEFSEILEKNKIDSFEKALLCDELFDINNGECLCSYHHLEKHNPSK